jgi:hypothetical protein
MFLRIDEMRAHVVFDDLSHETRHRAARAGDEVHNLLAPRLFLESAFYAVNLSPNSTNARKQLFLIANRMAHSAKYSIPPLPISESPKDLSGSSNLRVMPDLCQLGKINGSFREVNHPVRGIGLTGGP